MNGTPEQWANLSRAVFDENRVPDDVVQAVMEYDELDRERERIRTTSNGSGADLTLMDNRVAAAYKRAREVTVEWMFPGDCDEDCPDDCMADHQGEL